MTTKWTVVRFPDGSWSTGGNPDDPDFARCEVYQVEAAGRDEAEKLAKAERRKAARRKLDQ